MQEQLECPVCKREYLYDSTTKQGHTRTRCNSCAVNERRFALRQKIHEHMGEKCMHCGYNRCLRALACHHRDPNTKSFTISGGHCYSWARLEEELQKCVYLCHNCHDELHDGLWGL